MRRTRIALILLFLSGMILTTTAFANAAPPVAIAMPEGRTHDQAHDTGYIDWSGPVQYTYMAHRDYSELPPEEGGAFCGSGCWEWVTHLGNGGTVSGSFDRDVAYFEVMVASTHDSSVGNATLRACSAVRTSDMYDGPGQGMPGFVSLTLSVPAGCRSWSLSASSGYLDFRSTDVIYGAPPPPPTNTWTPLPSVTLSATWTPTLTPTATLTPTSTATSTPSSTPTALPPEIVGQIVCDLWGDNSWCKGNESLDLVANDLQGFDVTISGDLNGVPYSCGNSCSVPLPEGVGTANYLASSTSGRTASGLSTWQRDSTPPVLDVVLPPLDGRNGWYVSEVDVSVDALDAISGLHSVAGSMDEGVTWNSFPFHILDGVAHVTARARDIAGNEAMKSEVVQVDTFPPIAQFTSHSSGQVIYGSVLLTGKVVDETSGASAGELSLDGGDTWHSASVGADDTLSFAWNTNEVPNGPYNLQMRGVDNAGNVGDATSLTLVIDNKGPHVRLTDRWWIWESGQLTVSSNYFPIASVKVTIRDPQNRWPEVVMHFDPDKIPESIFWDRRFDDGTLAPSGEYRVVAVACDNHDLCGNDTGIIGIPFVATATPTLTLPPSPTASFTATPITISTATERPATSVPILGTPSLQISPEPTESIHPLPFWQVVGLISLFIAISSASVVDPRPAALDRLGESLKLISSQNKIDSSEHKK